MASKKFNLLNPSRGFVTILLLLIVIALAILFSGALFGPQNTPGTGGSLGSGYLCCDSGDGDACKTSETEKFTWKGFNAQPEEYALLKSDIALNEANHLKPSSEKTPDGGTVFYSDTDSTTNYCESGKDVLSDISGCIPNDEIIYVCTTECPGTVGVGKFDAYFRIKDGEIPDVVKNCTKPQGTGGGSSGQEIVISTEAGKTNLQLQTFKIIEKDIPAAWLSPYCKPAVYLYPEQTSYVSVRINSSEPLTYSDPVYPNSGWGVIAEPSGLIHYQNKPYDYLYYETKVADQNLVKPDEGFVVEKNELKGLLTEILPKLGLNVKETQQFSDYWLKALPKSPYYFVGIVPQTTLTALTSLSVLPHPATEIRVTLYFEPLEQKISVDEPTIITPVRTGFTVVEWGGIFKKNKNTDFSCFQ